MEVEGRELCGLTVLFAFLPRHNLLHNPHLCTHDLQTLHDSCSAHALCLSAAGLSSLLSSSCLLSNAAKSLRTAPEIPFPRTTPNPGIQTAPSFVNPSAHRSLRAGFVRSEIQRFSVAELLKLRFLFTIKSFLDFLPYFSE